MNKIKRNDENKYKNGEPFYKVATKLSRIIINEFDEILFNAINFKSISKLILNMIYSLENENEVNKMIKIKIKEIYDVEYSIKFENKIMRLLKKEDFSVLEDYYSEKEQKEINDKKQNKIKAKKKIEKKLKEERKNDQNTEIYF